MIDVIDKTDEQILENRKEKFNSFKGPRVGDFIVVDGEMRRIAYLWNDSLQPTTSNGLESFHLTESGTGNFSGGLDSPISLDKIINSGQTRLGQFWFFHHNHWTANNAVHAAIVCRVYVYVA